MPSTKYPKHKSKFSDEQIRSNVAKVINNRAIKIEEVAAISSVAVPQESHEQHQIFVQELYKRGDILLCQAARLDSKCNRFTPTGPYVIDCYVEILWAIVRKELGRSFYTVGGFMPLNPFRALKGSGRGGRFTDADISRHEYCLLEHDDLPIEQQLALLCSLALPIVSMVHSGAKSIHALVRVGAASAEEYEKRVRELYSTLECLGFDPSNKNPSRFTRCPGPMRQLPDGGKGQQFLCYLNPSATSKPIFDSIGAR